LMILANPPVSQPRDALTSGKPVVFIMANIHAGEVEGKEASLTLARRLLIGDLRPLLDKLVVLIAPDYNADGNEKISTDNRVAQNGPIGGVGVRENSQGLDLNRDYIKADAPETRALLSLFNRYDPHITVDLHTTNGSYHGYHLTYSIPLNPNTDPKLALYHRGKMTPALTAAMADHHFRTYYYGNFVGPAPAPGQPDSRSWQAFSPAPRVGTNYVGIRNRLAILSEAYSYLDFHKRIDVTEAFCEEILRYSASHADEIRAVCARADADTIAAPSRKTFYLGIDSDFKALPEKVDILVGKVTHIKNPRSGREMTAMVEDEFTPVKMLDYGKFAPGRTIRRASAYLLTDSPETQPALQKLLAHGITVEQLTAPLTTHVQTFDVDKITRPDRTFQSHRETHLTGTYKTESLEFPSGTFIVRTNQALGLLASYLLEPESDDGLTTWNFFDALIAPGKPHPVYKCDAALAAPAKVVQSTRGN
jgi:zinc carboxypeptidase